MNRRQPSFAVHFLPSLADLAFLMPLVFLFTRLEGARTLLGDCDTGWHIRTGEWILANGRVPDKDIFSFTRPDAPWIAWEWLWDISFAWLFRHGGLATVVLISMLLLCATFGLLYRVVERRCGNPLIAIGVTALAAAGSSMHWLARPHLVSWVFLLVFLAILDRARDGHARLLWCLPLLTILWANLHAGFLVGIVLLGAHAAGSFVHAAQTIERADRVAAVRTAMRQCGVAAACLAASLINPYFYRLHLHMLHYLRDPYQYKNIVEFQSTNFQGGGSGYFEAMLMAGLAAAIWFGARRRFVEPVLLVLWAHFALLVVRNIPIYMLIAAPAVAEAAAAWSNSLRRASVAPWLRGVGAFVRSVGVEIRPLERVWRFPLLPAAAVVVLAVGLSASSTSQKLRTEFDEKTYPAQALALLQDPTLRIFTNDEWGDYLIYRLSPGGTKVFVDGRSDMYGATFGQEYIDVMNVKGWEQTLERYGVDTILLPPDAPLAGAIKESSRWRTIYQDACALVFRPANAAAAGQQVSSGMSGERVRDGEVTDSKARISQSPKTI